MQYSSILIRATNWIGDAVMSLPALRCVRARFPTARIAVLARPWVAGLYARESFAGEVILYTAKAGARDFASKWKAARDLRRQGFDCALLLPNSFESAALARLAGIPERIGYDRDGRGWLLSQAIRRPAAGEIPRHESFYYLELLRRAGWIERLPERPAIHLEGGAAAAAAGRARFGQLGIPLPVVGLSPGAAYGGAKRWLPERFAEAAGIVALETGAAAALFGSPQERALCEAVAEGIRARGVRAWNLAGRTSLSEFIELAAACRVYLTNDSGAMHIAGALGVPTVAVFGSTDAEATGPAGERSRVVREPVDCSPCLLRECPIDHRCMSRVSAARVATTALELLK